MKRFYSVFEQHIDGSWWYHRGYTFDSQKQAQEAEKKLCAAIGERPTRIFSHNKPLPQDSPMGLCYMGDSRCGFCGLVLWEDDKTIELKHKEI